MDKIKYYKKSVFLLIFVFMSFGILYSQEASNESDSLTNLPNSKKLASNIGIKTINEDSLYVEWEGIYHPNLTYYVYRSNNPILSRPLLTTATVIGSVKATNSSNLYSMLDILPNYGKYYYAVISYVDNIGFYTADSDVDTIEFEFKEPSSNTVNTDALTIPEIDDVLNTNDSLTIDEFNEPYSLTNFITQTNFYNVTNYYDETNYHNVTNYYNEEITDSKNDKRGDLSNNVIKNRDDIAGEIMDEPVNQSANDTSINEPQPSGSNNYQSEYDRYNNEYNKALAQFKLGNYSTVITILSPISKNNVNRTLYYNINLLLGKSYKYAGQRENALNTFKSIQSINSSEVSFWINQVLSDL